MRGLLIFILAFIVTGCTWGNASHVALDDAESVMGTDPEEAFEQLSVIDVSEFTDSAAVARWAFLYSDAMMRCRLAAPSDTIVSIAVHYYAASGEQRLWERSKEIRTALLAHEPEEDPLLQVRYGQKVKEYFLYKERRQRQHCVLAGGGIFFLLLGLMGWLYRRLRQQTWQNGTLLAQAVSLRDAMAVERELKAGLKTAAGLQFSNRFRFIDRLCITYYENQGTAVERNAIAREVKREIESLKCGSKTFSVLEAAVADVHPDWLASVREALPRLSTDDYQLLIYLICGFSPQAISIFIGEKVETIYKRKSRLKGRILRAEGRCRELLLPVF